MQISCLQTNPQENIEENVNFIMSQIRLAKENSAQVVVLPEMFTYMGEERNRYKTKSNLNEGIFSKIQLLAKELDVHIIAGSHSETIENKNDKVYNTSVAYSNQGEIISVYRKIHLFNLKDKLGKKLYCESDSFEHGSSSSIYNINCNGTVWKAFTIICYDLRFPEIIRNLKEPVDILFVPAAFTWQTGRDHWEILLRARAIENQCYVVACNQAGYYSNEQKRNFGNSMVIDPWGTVVSRLGEEVGFLNASVSKEKIEDCRQRLPVLQDRRLY